MNAMNGFALRLAVSLTASLTCGVAAADVTVKGVAKLDLGNGRRVPLPNIYIQAYREGGIFPMPKQGSDKGVYSVNVPAGSPFKLKFFDAGKRYLYETDNLDGTDGGTINVDPIILNEQAFVRKHGQEKYDRLLEEIKREKIPKE